MIKFDFHYSCAFVFCMQYLIHKVVLLSVSIYVFYIISHRFKMAVCIGNIWFPAAECTNKKDGKSKAADLALRTLLAEGSYQPPTSLMVCLPKACNFCC